MPGPSRLRLVGPSRGDRGRVSLATLRRCAVGAVLALWVVAGLPTGSALAQSTEDAARALTAQGELLFEAGNFEAALAEFEEAYDELEANPDRYILLFNIGQCYERTFRYDRALTYYRRYLSEGGAEAEGHGEVEATIRALEGLLATVEITVNVPAAAVWVDGLEVGTAPGTLMIPGGVHRVEVRAAGHSPEIQEVQVAARQSVTISFELEELSTYRGLDSAVFWVTTATAAATLAAGAGVGIATLVEQSAVTARPSNLITSEDRQRLTDQALVADVLYGAGCAVGIAAIVLAFMTDWGGAPASAAPEVAIVPVLGPGFAGVVVGGTL